MGFNFLVYKMIWISCIPNDLRWLYSPKKWSFEYVWLIFFCLEFLQIANMNKVIIYHFSNKLEVRWPTPVRWISWWLGGLHQFGKLNPWLSILHIPHITIPIFFFINMFVCSAICTSFFYWSVVYAQFLNSKCCPPNPLCYVPLEGPKMNKFSQVWSYSYWLLPLIIK